MPGGAAWFSDVVTACVPSPVSYRDPTLGDLIFVVFDWGNWLTCFDATDGTIRWQESPFDSGPMYYPSPVLVGDRVYLLNRDGGTVIFKAQGTGFEEVPATRPQLGTGSRDAPVTYDASPAFANGRIYVRSNEDTDPSLDFVWQSWLYCIGN